MQTDPISDMISEGDPNTEERLKQSRETVLVTGSSGFIGREICERLSGIHNVIGFDRPGLPNPPPSVDRIDVDLTSDESVKKAFQNIRQRYGNKLASVIHLAAFYDFSGKSSPKYEEITVQGTARLLRFLKSCHVEQFVFSSTMLVHAPCQPGRKITEDSPLEPKWDYPKSKVKTENLIRRERGKMPVVLVRIAGVYDNQCHSIPLANQIQRIFERRLTGHLFPGNPSHGQAFVHLDDIVNFLSLVVAKRKQLPPELVLLAGEPETLSYEFLQRELGKLIHDDMWRTRPISKSLAKAGASLQDHMPFVPASFIKPWMIDIADDHYELDISRAKKRLGWEPRRSLKETLPLMVASLKKDPENWYKENKLRPARRLKKAGSRKLPPPPPPTKQQDEAPPLQNRIKEPAGTIGQRER